ncbi:(2Fe-2S)-binding protein [Reyranella sp.]|jgi:isoquinoline 1-oxidoreductase alpha subunit|uniref:(2Fe-2S)-binding protein n=1 Tax=Reyranella sp. TaxID=1929291 RepID=UPI000BD9DC05|nr:(2Fe-2S)-binding protein [Reyranella sp.]OYY42281.1 MAG: (2Fe-2S)-binding protein [Rhodospirillales bacterium 35-66-84]OYZ93966.1 MAG: (2Fe-2S)-binding protein [Rhodospirillales bacterium 24-66-33]OZB22383.1 MAG: (2Fe-2S)-binding protein [Rhodospirillales bacterium 39-66-50]HQS17496.1 (2Fe-2S)-binding protein [Reyranella sp.]HQT14375.1 (2Fe-2S)-binding protein [Reyranella sp.]
MAVLNVNGKAVEYTADPETPLLWVLREQLGLTGTKYACGIAQCGSCTVHIDGAPVRSCSVPVNTVGTQKVVTIEALAENGVLTKIQKAWVELDVPQCGYCQSGMVMAATALLTAKPNPTDADIDEAMTNICRCGTYQQVRAAIHAAAKV